MPDQGDPIRGAEERFAEAVELGRPSSTPADDADLARDLEIAGMLRALGPAFSPSADAKARMRARVMGALAVEGPPSDGGGIAVGRPQENGSEGAPTEVLPVVAPAPVDGFAPIPLRAVPTAAEAPDAEQPRDEAGTTVLAEPDLSRAVRPRRRRRHALPSRPAARPDTSSLARRVVTVGMAAALAVLAIAGGSVFASRDAVPGDALYGIKRAAEAAGGIFAGGEAARGQHDLDLATTRLDEIERMARDGATDPAAYTAAFQEFDAATRAGTRQVLAGADPDRSAADLARWATQQTTRLSALRATLPAGRSDADDALNLLDRVHDRAVAVAARSGCGQVTSSAADDLGPLPAEGSCAARQATAGTSAGATPDRVRTTAPTEGTPQGGQEPQENGGSDPALVPGDQGSSNGQNRAATTPTTSPAPSSEDRDNLNVPLPLPLPITVPPLVPGKPGGLLG
jgi:uncharacterized protein DUF5667